MKITKTGILESPFGENVFLAFTAMDRAPKHNDIYTATLPILEKALYAQHSVAK